MRVEADWLAKDLMIQFRNRLSISFNAAFAWLYVWLCITYYFVSCSSPTPASGPASPHSADSNMAYANEATK